MVTVLSLDPFSTSVAVQAFVGRSGIPRPRIDKDTSSYTVGGVTVSITNTSSGVKLCGDEPTLICQWLNGAGLSGRFSVYVSSDRCCLYVNQAIQLISLSPLLDHIKFTYRGIEYTLSFTSPEEAEQTYLRLKAIETLHGLGVDDSHPAFVQMTKLIEHKLRLLMSVDSIDTEIGHLNGCTKTRGPG